MPDTSQTSFDVSDSPPGLMLVGLAAIGINIYGLFSWRWIAVSALAYVGLCVLIWAVLFLRPQNERPLTILGHLTLLLSLFAALVLSILVGGLLLIPFKIAAWIVVGLFSLAILFFIVGDSLHPIAIFLSLLMASGLAAGVYFLNPPIGSPERQPEPPVITTLIINVTNDEGLPMGDIELYVKWKNEWEAGSQEGREYTGKTWKSGIGSYITIQDPAGRIAVVTAEYTWPPLYGGRYVGSPLEVRGVRKGETRTVNVRMKYVETPGKY